LINSITYYDVIILLFSTYVAVTGFHLKENEKILAKLKTIQKISLLVNHVCLCDSANSVRAKQIR
jgi:hypothetical protein